MSKGVVADHEQEQHEAGARTGTAAPYYEHTSMETLAQEANIDNEMQVDTHDEDLQDDTTSKYTALFSLQGHKSSVSSLSISPDGQQLVSSGVDGLLKIWSLGTGALIATLDAAVIPLGEGDEIDETAPLRLGLSDVAWSKDGQYIATGGDDCVVRVWDATRHSLVRHFHGHTSYIFCVNFHPNTSLAVSGGFDETVRLWNLQRSTCHRVISAHSEAVTAVDFNIDGSILASSSYDGQIRLWDSYTGQCLKTLVSEGDKMGIGIGDIKFSPNSFQILATSLDHTIRLWDIANSRVVKTYLGHQNERFAIKACFSAFKEIPKRKEEGEATTFPSVMIIAGSENNRIHLWDLQSRKVVQTLSGHRDAVTSIATHPSIHIIATASLDRDPTIRVWRLIGDKNTIT